MSTGVIFDRESAGQIAETVRRSRPPGHIGRAIAAPAHAYRPPICGVLLEDLDPAVHPRTEASWALGAVWAFDPNEPPTDTEPRKLQRTTRREHIVNRSVVRSAAKGTYFEAEWKDSEWRATFLDCDVICGETCEWTWEQPTSLPGAWAADSVTGCEGDCECVEPDFVGSVDGETATTECETPEVIEFEAE